MSLRNRTLFITGASRGIGLAIALRAARDGANVIVAAKTAEPHPKLPGTIHTAARAIEEAGGQALPLVVDVREEDAVAAAVEKAVATFGGIDILVNNASAISLTGTLPTPVRIYSPHDDGQHARHLRAARACLPHLKRAENPHILNLSPPLNMDPRWFAPHVAYTMAKYGMSLCVLGMAREFAGRRHRRQRALAAHGHRDRRDRVRHRQRGAAQVLPQTRDRRGCGARDPERKEPRPHGRFLIDDEVLAAAGVTDFDRYQVEPGAPLALDFFLDDQGPYIKRVVKLPGSDYG